MQYLQYLNPLNYFSNGVDIQTQIQHITNQLNDAKSYEEWYRLALLLDQLEGNESWKDDPESNTYDFNLISSRCTCLKIARQEMETNRDLLVRILRSGLLRNLGGIGQPELYTRVHVGTKKLIEDYVETVTSSLKALVDDETFPLHDKFDFFWETRQSFGRSALLLSGGATLGLYHLGVIKTLFEHDLLPRVISGSSVGSIIASIVAVHTDEELPELFALKTVSFSAFDPVGSRWRKINRLFRQGVLMDVKKLQSYIRSQIKDLTFREAYSRTKRILNITVAPANSFESPRLLNYLTSPDVLIWSAASASCALTGLYEPVELMVKDLKGDLVPYHPSPLKWSDGSVTTDLPVARLSELFNVNHFIVSQVNPHVIPFISGTRNQANGQGIYSKFITLCKSEIIHRINQAADLGIIPRKLDFLASVSGQSYKGHITIVPTLKLEDYANLLANPTVPWIKECMLKSGRNTWESILLFEIFGGFGCFP
eukprot:TRINITY_DN3366_c0_g1_i2.p1 TRINITY_DN3366_c0_g1~~TRINITY_DN3366_c0_g1_i2.p1  ORF type:complete len:484 (-),score=77.40 TRINITY_DN3366_c0_g1_i2:158-1609(-)